MWDELTTRGTPVVGNDGSVVWPYSIINPTIRGIAVSEGQRSEDVQATTYHGIANAHAILAWLHRD